MADLKNVIYLSNEDFATLSATGTVTINGEVLTYDEDCVYITPDAIASHVEAGLMSPDDKIKLDGIASGAQPGTITGITMNGASKGTSGVVDLGTVVTAETDTLSSVLNRGNQATKDVNMNSKDVYNAGTILLTYNYSTEQTPNTQYYWYRLPLPGSGIGDKYYISISGDNNYPIDRGNYILELSNYSSGTSYSVSLNNLGSTLRASNPVLFCAIDTSGYVYIQASVAWTCVMRVTRIMTQADNTTSASYTQVGKGAAGVANGFTPAKMFSECGSARIYNGALDTSTSNVGGVAVSADKFIEGGTLLSNKYLLLDGSVAMNGNIKYAGSKATTTMVKFYDNTADANGNGIGIGGGGVTIIGSGESTAAVWSGIGANAGNEYTYVASDNDVYIVTNLQNGWSNRKVFDFATDGSFNAITLKENGTALSDKYQAKLVSGTNIKTVNNNSLLGSGNLTVECDPIPSSDVIDTLYFGRSMTHTPATFMGVVAVPSNSIGKVYLDGFKGNSAVVNQLASLFNHFDYLPAYGTGVFNSGEVTITPTAQFGSLYKRIRSSSATLKKGHKYFISVKAKGETASEIKVLMLYDGTWHYGYQGGLTSSYTTYTLIVELQNDITTDSYFRIYQDNNTSDWKPTTLRDLMIIDLGINGITSTVSSEVKAALKHKGMDVDSYIPQNAGTLTDSKPTKLISYGKNLCDKTGFTTYSYGADYLKYNSANATFLKAGTYTLSFRQSTRAYIQGFAEESTASQVVLQDIMSFPTATTMNFTWSGKCAEVYDLTKIAFTLSRDIYLTVCFQSGYAGTLPQIEIGTEATDYAPYVPPIEYDLTMPNLKSAGSVQDESKAGGMKVGKGKLKDLNWERQYAEDGWNRFKAAIADAVYDTDTDKVQNILCAQYATSYASAMHNSDQTDKIIALGYANAYVKDTAYTDATAFKNHFYDSDYANYELATPTDFADLISYPEIFNVYAGGVVEVVGDGCDATVDVEWIS